MGCGPGKMTPVFKAVEAGDAAKVREIIRSHPNQVRDGMLFQGGTVLHYAASLAPGEEDHCIDALLSAPMLGLDTKDRNGFTAAMLAAAAGKDVRLRALLRAGSKGTIAAPETGDTVMHLAAGEGHDKCVQAALDCGVPPDVLNKAKETPLHKACAAHSLATVQVLLSADPPAKVTLVDESRTSPLHKAAADGDWPCAEALLKAGADRAAKDANNKTPAQLAMGNGHSKVAEKIGVESIKEEDIERGARAEVLAGVPAAKDGLQPMDDRARQKAQELMDATWKDMTTRDRGFKSVPKFEVVQVLENRNSEKWQRYLDARSEIMLHYVKRLEDVKTVTPAFEDFLKEPRVPEANEFYLFHGTRPQAATSICQDDFRVDLSGSNKGSLYGPGIYLAESSSKADEYAMDDEDGLYRGLFAMLLCRVTLGNPVVTVEVEPDLTQLANELMAEDHHSILGDREAAKGTFREFIVRDVGQCFPAFAIIYRRKL